MLSCSKIRSSESDRDGRTGWYGASTNHFTSVTAFKSQCDTDLLQPYGVTLDVSRYRPTLYGTSIRVYNIHSL